MINHSTLIEKFETLHANYQSKNVVFDFFDTIVHRTVHPQHTKRIASKILAERMFNLAITADYVYDLRVDLEAKICKWNLEKGFDLDFNFDQFAKELFLKIETDLSFEDFHAELLKIEVEVEKAVLFKDEEVVLFIEYLFNKGFNLFLCSDFYLPSQSIIELMMNLEIRHYFQGFFVSSEYLLTKHSGRIYSILHESGIKNAIMIGDNRNSDYDQAKKVGWEAIHLDRKEIYYKYEQHKEKYDNLQFKIAELEKAISSSSLDKFSTISPTLFYFIYKLYFELKKFGFVDVIFLSREGQVLKELFDFFQKKYIQKDQIQSHYFLASRRSTFIPSLKKIGFENFEILFRQYRKISCLDFLMNLGFEESVINELSSELTIELDFIENDFPSSESFDKLMQSDLFIKTYEGNRTLQNTNFKKYIDSLKLKDSTKIAIVDVGWKGTIQDNIQSILGEKHEIYGFYVGLVKKFSEGEKINKYGILFDENEVNNSTKLFKEFLALFEVLLAADHGSPITYTNTDHGVVIETEDFSQEEHFFNTQIAPIINTIKINFKTICDFFYLDFFHISELEKYAIFFHSKTVFTPTALEIQWFMNIYHIENFGKFGVSKFELVNTKKWEQFLIFLSYLKNRKKFTEGVFWPYLELYKKGLKKSSKKYGIENLNFYQRMISK